MLLLLFLAYALVIGLCVAWVWSFAFDTHGPWNSFFWFFFVIFLFAWGAGAWVTPFGPTGWGVAWLPLVFLGLFMALLLTAVTPRSARRRRRPSDSAATAPTAMEADAEEKAEIAASVDTFFWVLILVLAFVILSNFLWHPRLY